MRKNFLYIGLLLFVLGLATAFVLLPSQASQHLNPIQKQLLLSSGSVNYVAIPMNKTGIIEAIFSSSSPVDFYFANSSAFGAIESPGPTSTRERAVSLEGKGVYAIYEGSKNAAFPIMVSHHPARIPAEPDRAVRQGNLLRDFR